MSIQNLNVTKNVFLPLKWRYDRLKEVIKVKHGRNQRKVEVENGPYPILGSGGKIGEANEFLWDKPSVLIGRKGTINKPQFYNTPFWTVDTLFYTKILNGYDPKWVYYLFQKINWLKYNEASGVPSLSASNIENIKVLIPPFEEQKKIADILSTWDHAIELKKKMIKNNELFYRILLKEIFDNKLYKRSKYKLGSIVKIEKGKQLSKIDMISDGRYPVINGGIQPSGYKDIYNTCEHTITISEGGNSCGFVNIIEEKFWSGGHCYTLSKKDQFKIDYDYLYHYLKSQQRKIQRLRVGSGLPNIQKSEITKFNLYLHDYESQIYISKSLNDVKKRINLLKSELHEFELQKKGLMQRLLTGQVRVQV